jgi:hypothetical protein
MIRSIASLILLTLGTPALAQPVNLGEKVAPGDRARYSLELELRGNLFVVQDGMKQPVRLEASARHAFAERVLAVNDGLATSSARHYGEARAVAVVAGEKHLRNLPDERRLIVARRGADGLVCFSPAGPLSRDELDLVTEHFNPHCLAGLLPGKVVSVNDTWTLSDNATQAACLFHGVLKNGLTGKLTEVKDGVATFTVEGSADGIENGAKVSLAVNAVGTFDVGTGRVTSLTWKQKDTREQGAVNPASEIEVEVKLKREPLEALPKELTDEALANLPGRDVPSRFTDLRLADAKGRYRLSHPRGWYVTGQTDDHLVLRLVDRGELVAQATITAWRKVEPGKHSTIEEFRKAVADTPGWVAGKTVTEGELPAGGMGDMGSGRWLYRQTVEGKIDNQPAIQTFYLLAGPKGDQVAVTVIVKPEMVRVIGTRDVELVRAIDLGK